MTAFKDMTGTRWGRLTVTGRAPGNTEAGQALWACRCDCGEEISTVGTSLRMGRTKSCGCLHREEAGRRMRHRAATARSVAPLPRQAIPGQNGLPGHPSVTHKLVRHLYAINGPTTTCGHDNPTIAVRTGTGEVLSCRRCVLAAVDDRPGVTYLEPQPGGDDAA